MRRATTFGEYDEASRALAVYPPSKVPFYPVLGICGEAGEVAEKVKKLLRDGGGVPTEAFVRDVSLELGDVLWYVAAAARDIGTSLEEVANLNLEKLLSRKGRGALRGSGDDR